MSTYAQTTQRILQYALNDRKALLEVYRNCGDHYTDIIADIKKDIKLIKERMK